MGCFTSDWRFGTRDGGVAVQGRDALLAFFCDVFAGPMAPPDVVTTHLMGNVVVTFAAGGAEATTLLDAVVHRWSASSGTVMVLGLRYRDRVVRSDAEGWLLAAREHDLRWQGEMPATAPGFAIRD